MRVVLKGGVWKNSEDEVLKAAVSKYGLNQWPRCASLLPRKTAKQCKARWHEWLDPSIRKTEWTREEEERLLHLAKLMPAQWRTIAPLVGRTPSQCVEQYERLLDAAAAGALAGEGGSAGAGGGGGAGGAIRAGLDSRRLRPGEIDPMPELKPARPDPVDMDEDEKEMLSEARARLANTKGKKAKRKAREKVLDEARRLAALQKLRELKAAGVDVVQRKKKKAQGIDYATEIPFERRAPAGFFDTTGDDTALLQAQAQHTTAFRVRKLNEIEDERKSEVEARERNKDKVAAKRLASTNLPAVLAAEAAADTMAIRKRPRLALPSPVLSLSELEDIAALGASGGGGSMLLPPLPGSSASMLLEDDVGVGMGGGGDGGAASVLSHSVAAAAARVRGRTGLGLPPTRAALLEEARNQLSQKSGFVSVLEGGDNLELEAGTGFSGATPKLGGGGGGGSRLVRGGEEYMGGGGGGASSVLRGGVGEDSASVYGDSASQYGGGGSRIGGGGALGLERERRAAASAAALALSTLPAPKNRLELAPPPDLPPLPPTITGGLRDPSWAGSSATTVDGAEARAQREAEVAAERRREEGRRSAVLRHPPPSLPRPLTLDEDALAPPVGGGKATELDFAVGMIQDELLALLKADAANFPIQHPAFKAPRRAPPLQVFTDEELGRARAMLDDATASAQWTVENRQGEALDAQSFARASEGVAMDGEAWREAYLRAVGSWEREAGRLEALEGKMNKLLKGYAAKCAGYHKEMEALGGAISDKVIELEAFKMLAAREAQAIPLRLAQAEELLEKAQAFARELQVRYAEITQ